ncbi:MAG: polysaccharide biosynthesis tyrosine autokinase [Candidatus Competibacteraceae bacterium]|nr:polysaccharide biosynthesis tyrosine autokinase [Candidatus Competibacteraceae bacterium]
MNPKNLIDQSSLIGVHDNQEEEINLGDYLAVIAGSKWLILAITLLVLVLGAAYALIARPIYSVDALLQVEEKGSSLGALDEVAAMFEGETPVNAEIEILRSRLVIGRAVDDLNLTVDARPEYLPLLGEAIARRHDTDQGPAEPPFGLDQFGLGQYAWGGETIQVDTFEVPRSWLGEPFILVAGEGGSFRLLEPEQESLVLEGRVGQTARGSLGRGEVILFVAELVGRPGTRFQLVRRSRLSAIKDIQEQLSVSEKGKQSGVLQIGMQGADPRQVTDVVNEIATGYVRQNVERKSAEAEQTLSFLEEQLPVLKERLESAEADLNTFRLERGSIDMPKETQVILEQTVAVESQLTQLQQKREELRQRFTPAHPTVVALDAQAARLTQDLEQLNQQVQRLPDTQQELLRLSRNVEVSTELYTSLLNSAQELQVAKAGTLGNVRIVDQALIPEKPVKPKKGMILAVSLVLGLFLGVVVAFVRRSLRSGVEDPELVEKQLGVPVYATIPHSRTQDKLARRVKGRSGKAAILAQLEPEDLAIESLRSLRTTLHFALLEAKNNIIMITGPSPGVGKSFLSVNLGAVLASSGRRVLLIDADLRKGYLNQYMGLERGDGLTDLISGTIGLEQAVHPTPVENLEIIPTGAIPPNPSELLLHERLGACLAELSKRYDHVLVDSPPVLAVTDAAIVGRLAGASLLVIKAGLHPLREIDLSVKRLRQAGVNLRGVLFNDVTFASSRYGYGKYVYHYAYGKGK